MRKLILILISASMLLPLSSCSSGSSSSTQTVLAQTAYSNASLSGTYSVQLVSPFSTAGLAFYSGIGTVQLNGAGSITGGTINIYFSGSTVPCAYSATGTYGVQNTALGTASLNLSSSTKSCTATETWQLSLAAADGGTAIQFAATDGNVISGTAVKQ